MIQTKTQLRSMFHITPIMFHMDEIVGQTPFMDLNQIQLLMMWTLIKALYKMKVNIAQEVQSHTRTNATKLQQKKENREELELVLE
jgi:hypothetical protein